MLKWFKIALYVVGGFLALNVLAVFVAPVIGGFRMGIDTPNGIDEAFYASVNGREEYVTIRGHDQANPAVLVVHDGHGVMFSNPDAFIALMDEYVRPLVPSTN
jgi:hypothetical protein